MKDLNDYLGTEKLNVKGDFFALLVAYFYYYRDMYSELSNHANLRKSIIIPVCILHKEIHKKKLIFVFSNFLPKILAL